MLKLFPLKIPTDSDIGTRFKAAAEVAGLTYWELLGRMLKLWDEQKSTKHSQESTRMESLEAEITALRDMVIKMVTMQNTVKYAEESKLSGMDTLMVTSEQKEVKVTELNDVVTNMVTVANTAKTEEESKLSDVTLEAKPSSEPEVKSELETSIPEKSPARKATEKKQRPGRGHPRKVTPGAPQAKPVVEPAPEESPAPTPTEQKKRGRGRPPKVRA